MIDVELGTSLGDVWDPTEIRRFAQRVEDLGYENLTVADHVLGADPSRYRHVNPFTYRHRAHEPLVLFAYVAAATTTLALTSSFIVLPPRQTVLAAKQAAELSILSGGRFRLGVGIGAGENEYEWAGEDFHTRGARLAAQVELLRRLWNDELVVDHHDRWHDITAGGLNPRPRTPIPVLIGGLDDRQLRRAVRLADGWIPHFERRDGALYEAVTHADIIDPSARYGTGAPAAEMIERLHGHLRDNGRDPTDFLIVGTSPLSGNLDDDLYWARALAELGVGSISVSFDDGSIDDRLDYLGRFIEAWRAM